ncbi:patatin-like phospholipase family protein [Hydrogenimonas cancrithermarum]|uniref:patatin-like phospholipase family protein n=1 Tax=Hydrogenimonas cancrithermarum TaxID=2993563 RepID=UPI00257262B0|nr:patatin-like phospholipase family protein [Hydrogenimonas cancrithermarum]
MALALSGGGVRVAAHLGIVEVLLENGFEIAAVSGSSGGALVGALLCDGHSPAHILKIFGKLGFSDMAKGFKRGGVFGLKGVSEHLKQTLSVETIEELAIDFTVACTDLVGGEIHYFDKGPIAELCVASSALVPIFSPVRYGDLLLADGGFMDNMPARPVAELGYPVIGINVNPILPKNPENLFETTFRALTLMMMANIEASKRYCDFFIEPKGCEGINILDLKRVEDAYEAGRIVAEDALVKLHKTLDSL